MNSISRRSFVAGSAACLGASLLKISSVRGAEPRRRVGVIGHTGRGGYGHGLDEVWRHLPQSEIVAVADPDDPGRAAAQNRLNVPQGFADYREMLKQLQLDVVAVCTRHPDQHAEMILAAVDSGVRGVYVEKPFCRTPAEADRILAACEKHGAKLAVAHRNRYHPTLQTIDQMLADGAIGNLLEIRGRGKGDRRGGAEDLWVLGSHVLNLVNYFGGEPLRCSAVLQQDGRRVTRDDVRPGNEALGLLAGNQVHARYEMSRGVAAYFDSLANDGTRSAGFGLQLVGSEGIIALHCDRQPLAHLSPGNPFLPSDKPRPWIPISTAGPGKPEPRQDLNDFVAHHRGPALDLLQSMDNLQRQPLCDARAGATTVEMICAVFDSHLRDSAAVTLPLENRENALAQLGRG